MKPSMQGKLIVYLFFLISFLFSTPPLVAEESGRPWVEDGIFAARPAMRPVRLTGYTRARHVMDIVSEVSDRCVKVEADVGHTIGDDGIFCVLDTTFIDLAIKKNRVNQKRLENMIAYQIKEVRRFEELVGRESAAQSTLDGIQNKLDQSEFELQTLKTEEADLKERRERYVIRVSPGWTITERTVEPGEWISEGTHLGKAGDFRKLLVPFSFSPEEYGAVKRLKGTARLHFPDEGETGITVEAEVERISPAFDPQTRKINVDLSVGKGLTQMRGGLRAELDLQLPDPSGAVLVPPGAVLERYEEFWLTRHTGEKVKVVFLGNGTKYTARVRSPEVKPGQKFTVKAAR